MSTERSLSWQAALVLPLAAGFLGTTLSIAVRSIAGEHDVTAASTASHSSSTATTTAISGPKRLIIPAIGLNAPVQSIELSKTGSGDIGVPSNFTDVAWYNRGPIPGAPGIAIIDGHLDGRTVPEAVFYHLSEVKEGESIYVEDSQGVLRRFVVTQKEDLPSDADTSALFAHSDTSQLALITCAGDWIPEMHQYADRTIVLATYAGDSTYI